MGHTTTHSPTPWRVDRANRLILSDAGKKVLTELEVADGGSRRIAADMDFICLACNHHAELVEALRACHDMLKDRPGIIWANLRGAVESVLSKVEAQTNPHTEK